MQLVGLRNVWLSLNQNKMLKKLLTVQVHRLGGNRYEDKPWEFPFICCRSYNACSSLRQRSLCKVLVTSLTDQCRTYCVLSSYCVLLRPGCCFAHFEHSQSARVSSKSTETTVRPCRFMLGFCHVVQVRSTQFWGRGRNLFWWNRV